MSFSADGFSGGIGPARRQRRLASDRSGDAILRRCVFASERVYGTFMSVLLRSVHRRRHDHRREGCGFGAQSLRTEGDLLESVGECKGDLFG